MNYCSTNFLNKPKKQYIPKVKAYSKTTTIRLTFILPDPTNVTQAHDNNRNKPQNC